MVRVWCPVLASQEKNFGRAGSSALSLRPFHRRIADLPPTLNADFPSLPSLFRSPPRFLAIELLFAGRPAFRHSLLQPRRQRHNWQRSISAARLLWSAGIGPPSAGHHRFAFRAGGAQSTVAKPAGLPFCAWLNLSVQAGAAYRMLCVSCEACASPRLKTRLSHLVNPKRGKKSRAKLRVPSSDLLTRNQSPGFAKQIAVAPRRGT